MFNTESSSVHVINPVTKDSTTCGWHFMCSKRAKGKVRLLDDITDYPWWSLCEKCLRHRREQLKTGSLYSNSDSE